MENTKKLNHYSFEEVIDTYSIDVVLNCQHLNDWLDVGQQVLSSFHQQVLSELPTEYKKNYIGWNEEELKMNMISPILRVADVNVDKKVKTFFERPLSGEVEGVKISLVTDCMVATPKKSGVPDIPYFFLTRSPNPTFLKGEGERRNPRPRRANACRYDTGARTQSRQQTIVWLLVTRKKLEFYYFNGT